MYIYHAIKEFCNAIAADYCRIHGCCKNSSCMWPVILNSKKWQHNSNNKSEHISADYAKTGRTLVELIRQHVILTGDAQQSLPQKLLLAIESGSSTHTHIYIYWRPRAEY